MSNANTKRLQVYLQKYTVLMPYKLLQQLCKYIGAFSLSLLAAESRYFIKQKKQPL